MASQCLGDLDDGWNADSSPLAAASPGESRRGVTPDGGQPESVALPAAAWLTKRQRRELAKQQDMQGGLEDIEKLLKEGKTEEAEAEFREALKLEPDYGEAAKKLETLSVRKAARRP